MPMFETLIKVLFTIAFMIVMARINGPKQISQMSFYDYVSGISVGSVAASICTNASADFWNGIFVIFLFLLTSFVLNIVAQKQLKVRELLIGKPIVLISHGKIQRAGLKQSKLDMNELLSNLRYSGYFNIQDVYTAILEPTGKISVQAKGGARNVRPSDLSIHAKNPKAITEVILDGKVQYENLAAFHKDIKWLEKQCNQNKTSIDEVMLATLDEQGTLSIY